MEDYYTIQTPGHHSTMFSELHVLQKQGVMCDVILAAEDGEVMAHKVVLMAASKYFRNRLSPVMGPTASKICLKGISVVELANLVKYIYTGKLLVAKETMDITLEISEILELHGVIQGYKDIISYEQMKENSANVAVPKPEHVSAPSAVTPGISSKSHGESSAVHIPKIADQVTLHVGPGQSTVVTRAKISSPSAGTQAHAANATSFSFTNEVPQPDSNQSSKVIVSEQLDDGSTVTYSVDSSGDATDVNSTHCSSNDFNFGSLYDQQYVDVSAGSRTPSKNPGKNSPQTVFTPPKLQQMVPIPTDSQKMAEERAQHQDLLTVAIETLSDVPHLKHHPHSTQPEIEKAVSSIAGSETTQIIPQNVIGVKPEDDNLEDFENGKTNTKTVTMSAGSVSNELGGKTDVYTVALDPSSVKSPLKMARPKKAKTPKEKEAEEKAKKYRQKKAEIMAGVTTEIKTIPSSDVEPRRGRRQKSSTLKQDFQYESLSKSKKKPFSPRILYISKNSGNDSVSESDTKPKVTSEVVKVKIPKEEQEDIKADDFGQVVNFDSDIDVEDDVDGMIVNDILAAFSSEESENKQIRNVGKTKADTSQADVFGPKASQTEKSNLKSQIGKEIEMRQGKEVGKLGSNNKEEKEKDKKPVTSSTDNTDAVSSTDTKGNKANNANFTKKKKASEQIVSEKRKVREELSEDMNEDKELDDLQVQSIDELTAEKMRSSATKRKTRTPRKLPLSDEEKGNESGSDRHDNIPVVRSRRSSRSLNLDKAKENKTTTTATNLERDMSNSDEAQSKKIRTDFDVVNIDCKEKDLSKPTEIKIIAQSKVDEKTLVEAEEQIHESVSKKIIIVPKNFQPEIRLKKRTTKEMLQLAKGMSVSPSQLASDEIELEMEAYETGEGDDDDDYDDMNVGGGKEGPLENSMTENQEKKTIKADFKRKNQESVKEVAVKKRKTCLEVTESTEVSESGQDCSDTQKDKEEGPVKIRGSSESDKSLKSKTCSGNTVETKKRRKEKNVERDEEDIGKTDKEEKGVSDRNCNGVKSSKEKEEAASNDKKADIKALKAKDPEKGSKSRKAVGKNMTKKEEAVTAGKYDESDESEEETSELGTSIIYACSEDNCLFSSKSSSSLRQHQSMFHDLPASDGEEQAESSSDVKKSSAKTGTGSRPECLECGKTFKSEKIMKKHKDYQHRGRKKITCGHCDFETPFRSSMNTHLKLKHLPEKPLFTCPYCSYGTPLSGNLRKHLLSSHGLFIVTKQHRKSAEYEQFEEGAIVTKDGKIFDPETMELPKASQRKAVNSEKGLDELDPKNDKDSKKPTRLSLSRLPMDDFLKEMMKRHEKYLQEPEKKYSFMCSSIAAATEHPSFPQASPQVRNTRANKIYNMKKLKPTFTEHSAEQSPGAFSYGLPGVFSGASNVPHVASEVEVELDDQPEVVLENVEGDPPTTVLTISEQKGMDGAEMIIINQNGKQTVVRSKDFYDTLQATGHDTNQTLGVISALLQAGEQIEIREQEEIVEIQNI